MDIKERKLRNNVGSSWYNQIGDLLVSPEMKSIAKKLAARRKAIGVEVAPDRKDLFKPFKYTQFEDIKVVIIGEEPDSTKDSANGFAYSSQDPFHDTKAMTNIHKELNNSFEDVNIFTADRTKWANQGVFLLNSCMSVEVGSPASHRKIGWNWFTDRVLEKLLSDPTPRVFMFWGDENFETFKRVNKNVGLKPSTTVHKILKADHPDEESFVGCNCFKSANDFLIEHHGIEIDWT